MPWELRFSGRAGREESRRSWNTGIVLPEWDNKIDRIVTEGHKIVDSSIFPRKWVVVWEDRSKDLYIIVEYYNLRNWCRSSRRQRQKPKGLKIERRETHRAICVYKSCSDCRSKSKMRISVVFVGPYWLVMLLLFIFFKEGRWFWFWDDWKEKGRWNVVVLCATKAKVDVFPRHEVLRCRCLLG